MNYRHAFHAGGFADVLKHAVLARILVHLRAKPAAFRVIDTHAGAGRYDLTGDEAMRGGEWRDGIGRLLDAAIGEKARDLLAPYLDAVVACNGGGRLTVYPGSPALVRALLRPQDRLIACELEPVAAAALARYLARDARCKAVAIDGWTALNAYVPPKERRGLVVVDPPFEETSEFARLAQGLETAHCKWPGPICCGTPLRSGTRPMPWRAAFAAVAWRRFYASSSALRCRARAPAWAPAA
jgi:23S rRNA (adenine2030-N6)-methyltransferase